jgi:hypothetical protein
LPGTSRENRRFTVRRTKTGEALAPYSGVQLAINERPLVDTARTMLGPERGESPPALHLEQDRELALQAGGVFFDRLFRQNFAVIESLESQPSAPAMLGRDDLLYRTTAMMLHPELFFAAGEVETRSVARRLDGVCQYIAAHLGQVITLSVALS